MIESGTEVARLLNTSSYYRSPSLPFENSPSTSPNHIPIALVVQRPHSRPKLFDIELAIAFPRLLAVLRSYLLWNTPQLDSKQITNIPAESESPQSPISCFAQARACSRWGWKKDLVVTATHRTNNVRRCESIPVASSWRY